MENLTEVEYNELVNARSEEEWEVACGRVKDARGGHYPADWYAKILRSGIANLVFSRFVKA